MSNESNYTHEQLEAIAKMLLAFNLVDANTTETELNSLLDNFEIPASLAQKDPRDISDRINTSDPYWSQRASAAMEMHGDSLTFADLDLVGATDHSKPYTASTEQHIADVIKIATRSN